MNAALSKYSRQPQIFPSRNCVTPTTGTDPMRVPSGPTISSTRSVKTVLPSALLATDRHDHADPADAHGLHAVGEGDRLVGAGGGGNARLDPHAVVGEELPHPLVEEARAVLPRGDEVQEGLLVRHAGDGTLPR